MIEFTNVSVDVDEYDVEGRHRRVKILSTMNLIVSERRVAVIGPNGAGKSTLLRLVNGLVEATDGTVTVDGINPSEDGRAARRHVGYIFTNPMSQLVMSTPVADVELSLRQRIRNRLERHEAAMQILADQGLEAVAGRSVHALSGGGTSIGVPGERTGRRTISHPRRRANNPAGSAKPGDGAARL